MSLPSNRNRAGLHLPTPDRSRRIAKMVNIVRRYSQARTIHLVMDNLNIHCRKTLTDYFGADYGGQNLGSFDGALHTEHGSWLNPARDQNKPVSPAVPGHSSNLQPRRFTPQDKAWNRRMNRNRVTINWNFTRRKARAKFGYKKKLISAVENRYPSR